VDTPSGGKHLLFKHHPGLAGRNHGQWRPKVDLLGDGYVCFYGDSADILNDLQDFPCAEKLLSELKTIEEAYANRGGTDWECDDSTDDIIWKATQVLTDQPNDIVHRDDVVRALHGLKASLGERWDELTPLVHSWLAQDSRNDDKWCSDHWERLKPNGSATIGSFFQVACVDRGRRVPMVPVPEGAEPKQLTAELANWYYISTEKRCRKATDSSVLDPEGFRQTYGHDSINDMVKAGNKAYSAAYRPDLHSGNGSPLGADNEGRAFFNTYRPPSYMVNPEHLDTPEWTMVEGHFHKLLANGTDASHVLDWAAWLVQNPGKKISWVPLIIGSQGGGKSTVFQILKAALGDKHAAQVNPHALNKEFNGFAVDYCLVGLEEVKLSSERYDLVDRLKELITSPTIGVRRMHTAHVDQQNIANYILFSNHEDALAVASGDRRWMVCAAKHETKEDYVADGMDTGYFDSLYSVIQRKPEIIHSGLKLRDVSGFNPNGHAPWTAAFDKMTNAALPADAFLLKEAIDVLSEIDGFNTDCIASLRLPEEVRYQIKGKALRRAFAHLEYVPWEGNASGRLEAKNDVGETRKSHLYVRRKYAKLTPKEAKDLMG